MDRRARIAALKEALQERILVLDGAMGTALQGCSLGPDDFGGAELEGCNEHLVLTRPDVIREVHAAYARAGADIHETNSFGGTPLVLAEYGLADKAHELNVRAARLAREVADAFEQPGRPRWVAGSIGPTTKAISVTGGVTFDELVRNFRAQAAALHEGGVDFFLVETCQDTRNVKAALLGIEEAQRGRPLQLPVAVSGTIEATGTMLAGQGVEALAASLEHVELLYLGLNCATGPAFMTDHLRTLAEVAGTRVACVPNAGLPDEEGRYLETPAMIARVLDRFCEEGWLNLVGGCCGTTPAHVEALAEVARRRRPRRVQVRRRSTLSGIDVLEVRDDERPVLVGERTNVIGSRKFKRLIAEGKLEEAAEIGRAQVKGGAQVIDVCLANPDRDEAADLRAFLDRLVRTVKAPLMIDSTDPAVIAEALTYCQGKAILNSVNLEEGEERFDQVVPLARRFGAALVVGCIDDDPVQGMGVTVERKLAIAERSHRILTETWGLAEEDLYFDPLVFPCGTGDAQYVGSAVATIEGVRAIKRRFPRCRTVLGISNVSFGLPEAGREVLNAVFLYHCVQAGLDLAIVNTEKLERYPSIPEADRRVAEDLLFSRGDDPVAAFAAHFRERAAAPKGRARAELPLDERIARCVIEGSREGLVEDLARKLEESAPLAIINGPLMAGMDEVGRLFGRNELIVAEVLQSAEVMKAAVAFLEPHLSKAETATRGKVLLATVKGDVHDIGKNLVEIILGNNGFQVVNLGIKVPPEQLIAAVKQHEPDVVGLSGLLVKSAQQMVATAEDLSRAGVQVPMLVGGAALSSGFVDRKISPAYGGGTVVYAQDAMSGLELAKKLVDPAQRSALEELLAARRAALPAEAAPAPRRSVSTRRSTELQALPSCPIPPDLDRHVLAQLPLDQVWRFLNPVMLYGRHLGLKGQIVRILEEASDAELQATEAGRKALELRAIVDEVKAWGRAGQMRVRAVYRFFRAASEGNALHLYGPDGAPLTTFEFLRQEREDGLCLSDPVAPVGGPADTIALFVTTAGEGIRGRAEALKEAGEYVRSHALQALALETAEAAAEYVHAQLRSAWGFPDPPSTTMLDRFRANYRGKRYSFGYPACPALEDQQRLFALLAPEELGVRLTEGFMMDPEASVSALVFHHPEASYFSVSDLGAARAGEGA